MHQDLALNFSRGQLCKESNSPEFPSSDLIHDIELGISAEVNLNLKIFHSGQRGDCMSEPVYSPSGAQSPHDGL